MNEKRLAAKELRLWLKDVGVPLCMAAGTVYAILPETSKERVRAKVANKVDKVKHIFKK